QTVFFLAVVRQEHGVNHLGIHRRHLAANAKRHALRLGRGEIATEDSAPDILQALGILLGFAWLAAEAGVAVQGLLQRFRVGAGHLLDPGGIRERIIAKAASQAWPSLTQLVAGIIERALVMGEWLPARVGQDTKAEQRE